MSNVHPINEQVARLMAELAKERAEIDEAPVLKSAGGDGTSGGMDATDAKIAAAEARTDTKFAELRSELHRLPGKGTVWGAVATIIGVLLAVAALAGDRFEAGLSVSPVLESVRAEQRAIDARQDAKLDTIIARLPAKPPASPHP